MVGPGPLPRFSSLPDDGGDGPHHFLDSCHLCKLPLGAAAKSQTAGDTPFCSEECRQEQIEMDEASERRSVMAQKQKAKNPKSPSKSEKIEVRVSGTVVAG
ncbi:uncharacterized protein A4U43_C04F12370 [Asparagus officinalis]|uniref:FLZ-type domain-containing protein n=1 Tax=Asparagus officinalis TaxID=4686 RepID=A0A5P1F096_ASPOF|nr:uncharacterized protein A4U43_C04F12370 [Asparagus officinalis]